MTTSIQFTHDSFLFYIKTFLNNVIFKVFEKDSSKITFIIKRNSKSIALCMIYCIKHLAKRVF